MSKRLVAIGSVSALVLAVLLLGVVAAVATTGGPSPAGTVPKPAPLWTDPLASPEPCAVAECVPATCEVGSPVQYRFISQTAPDAVVSYQWDFDGDGRFDVLPGTGRDWASVLESHTHEFQQPGTYRARLKITTAAGREFSEACVVEVLPEQAATAARPVLDVGSLSVSQRVLGHAAGQSESQIEMALQESTRARITIKNGKGTVVRELLNQWQNPGSSTHLWDGKEDDGQPVRHGVYDVALEVQEGFGTREIKDPDRAGFERYRPASTMVPRGAQYEVRFEVPEERGPSRVLAVVGKRSADSSASDATPPDRLRTLLDFEPFPVGSHVVVWDGLAGNLQLPVLSDGEEFFVEIHGYTLGENAIFVNSAPQLSKLAISSNLTEPFGDTIARGEYPCATITYDLDRRADVRLSVVDLAQGRTIRTVLQDNQPAGTARTVEWDGRGENSRFANAGEYWLVLQAVDSRGNASLCSSAVQGVGPGSVPPTSPPWAEDLAALKKDLLAKMDARQEEVDEKFEGLGIAVENNTGNVGKMREDFDALGTGVKDVLNEHDLILQALSEDNEDGVRVLRLDHAMQNSPKFAEEFGASVIDSLQREGKLFIVNKTNRFQPILLNEKDWITLEPSGSDRDKKTLEFSPGTVTTRLPGQELVTWRLGPPDFYQGIQIIERKDILIVK